MKRKILVTILSGMLAICMSVSAVMMVSAVSGTSLVVGDDPMFTSTVDLTSEDAAAQFKGVFVGGSDGTVTAGDATQVWDFDAANGTVTSKASLVQDVNSVWSDWFYLYYTGAEYKNFYMEVTLQHIGLDAGWSGLAYGVEDSSKPAKGALEENPKGGLSFVQGDGKYTWHNLAINPSEWNDTGVIAANFNGLTDTVHHLKVYEGHMQYWLNDEDPIVIDVTMDAAALTSGNVGVAVTNKTVAVKSFKVTSLKSDGTVGSSHDAVKLIVKNTDFNAQAYSVYDAHKSGGLTVSHVRVGKEPIQSEYLVQQADYVACHNSTYVRKFHMVNQLKEGGIFVLNSPWNTLEELEQNLPNHLKRDLATKKAQFYNIDATGVAQSVGLKQRINMIMQSVFFNLCPILPEGRAPKLLEKDIAVRFGSKGQQVVDMNLNAVKQSLSNLHKIEVPAAWANLPDDAPIVWPAGTPEFLQTLYPALYMEADKVPVSKFVSGGVQPAGTSKYEKRGIATEVPVWDPSKCTQCNQCATLCTHVCIRPFLMDAEESKRAPESFKMIPAVGDELKGLNYRIQVSPMDCTSCEVCSVNCPTNALTMTNFRDVKDVESKNWDFAMTVKNKGDLVDKTTVKGCAFQLPMLEFPGACAGCGETQSVRILTQLFGKRLMVANAMGCSRVWGGTFCSNPYTVNERGQGPAWGSSLFEDNAEFGFGMMTSTLIKRRNLATRVERILKDDSIPKSKELCANLQTWLENPRDADKCEVCYDNCVALLANEKKNHKELELLEEVIDVMPKLTQWVVGGDGWAYDIGYGGVDHVLAQGEDINVLVLDTEMYANTGGQQSKATQMSAVAKFAAGGKPLMKKDLGRMAMQYKNVYVASIAVAADPRQAIKAIVEAESYDGPSLVINYSPCMQHGMPASTGMSCMAQEAEKAVSSGYWPLYRYDPRRAEKGDNPFQLDFKKIKTDVGDFLKGENRFTTLDKSLPDVATQLHATLKQQLIERHEDRVRMAMSDKQLYKYLQKKFEKK